MNGIKFLAYLLAMLAIIASIMTPPGYGFGDLMPLWGPFEVIRSYNRWICIVMSFILVVLVFFQKQGRSLGSMPLGIMVLFGIHILIFLKNIQSSPLVAGQLLAGVILLFAACSMIAGSWARSVTRIARIWYPFTLAGLGFLAVNAIQYMVNPEATMLVGGRFHGTTSNPQMFALSTAILAPILLFQYAQRGRYLQKGVIIGACLLLVYFVVLTGSRLAALLTLFSVVIFYRQRIFALAAFLLPVIGVLLFWTSMTEEGVLDRNQRILSVENTRGHVWVSQLEMLSENPMFGTPLKPGARVEFGENSFLAAGVGVGFAGLLLILAFSGWLAIVIWKLIKIESQTGWRPEFALPIAILSSCLVAAFFEAFLLGIFTFPLICMIYAVISADVVVQRFESRQRSKASKRQQAFLDYARSAKASRRGGGSLTARSQA